MVQARARESMRAAMEKSIMFVRDNNQHFIARGLMWNVPIHFPQWIELWVNVQGSQRPLVNIPVEPIQGIPIMARKKRPEIHTVTMPQQEYQGVSVDQEYYSEVQRGEEYNGDMYQANV